VTFLREPEPGPDVRRLYDDDLAGDGYVMDLTRGWAHRADLHDGLAALLGAAGDAYCSLAWGARLAAATDADTAAGVLRGDDAGLDDRGRALAAWARAVARDPNGTTEADVQGLRDVGLTDPEIVAVTAYVALRMAFSAVNGALGARPDAPLRDGAPAAVRAAVSYGRPAASG
jgi:alkylhydroperoxidase/carboxymuconolactone decarboxylase family protein YurZ